MRASRAPRIGLQPLTWLLGALGWTLSSAPAQAVELSGYLAVDTRIFTQSPPQRGQQGDGVSLAAEPELYQEWNDGRLNVTFRPFARWDQHDYRRTHWDIRELSVQLVRDAWELRAGIGKVFWGVTESRHLVDIINQTDLVEDLDEEDKLGQPMLDLSLVRPWGTVDLFVLPGFRERTFPGVQGRLRSVPRVATERARFESGAGSRHVDWALRWSHSIGDWDLGLAHFQGTSREPTLIPGRRPDGEPVLFPLYEQIGQTSLDLQATKGDWLWKLEAAHRTGQTGGRFTALVGGFEYTRVGVAGTRMDLGLLAEYLYDSRGARAMTPFEDDLFLGLRLTANDAQSSELLMGVVADRDSPARFYNLEASRRLGDAGKLSLEARFVSDRVDRDDPLFSLRHGDHIQIELAWFF